MGQQNDGCKRYAAASKQNAIELAPPLDPRVAEANRSPGVSTDGPRSQTPSPLRAPNDLREDTSSEAHVLGRGTEATWRGIQRPPQAPELLVRYSCATTAKSVNPTRQQPAQPHSKGLTHQQEPRSPSGS
ncbi:hypothetical protein KSE_38060 [Kitasatospora setae KM-6054]|uniref:Uncharacterized protein n=1 Tax=Kitasatospora setae (strain ATCC 33774 / DSM 43861 / JCM 3304 / KCC A-0304 / NBRC 14216 / KM-6054) TaxID=452652 RepID=E4NEH2_KITSK|nr:hypothetical protein KSE_38060 [Kitasatospora setae KM-6054]